MKFIVKLHCLLCACIYLCFLAPPLRADVVALFNARSLLDRADVVCYGKVVSVKSDRIRSDKKFSLPFTVAGTAATVQVISLIKGQAPRSINVIFKENDEKGRINYTQLVQGESSILFLKRYEDSLRFVDDHNGTLEVPLHKPLAYKALSPVSRMVAELVYASKTDSGSMRLNCIEQLGAYALPEVESYLVKLTFLSDMAVQGAAYASLIVLDHPPQADRLAAFFKRQDNTRTLERFRTTAYSNGQIKARILVQLEGRFNVICRDLDFEYTDQQYVARRKMARAAAQRWKAFDLVGFLNVAVRHIPSSALYDDGMDAVSYRSIADMIGNQIDFKGQVAYSHHTYRKGSRVIVCELLGSTNFEVSEAAARAIDKMIAEKHEFPYSLSTRYVQTVREWVKNHPRWVKSD